MFGIISQFFGPRTTVPTSTETVSTSIEIGDFVIIPTDADMREVRDLTKSIVYIEGEFCVKPGSTEEESCVKPGSTTYFDMNRSFIEIDGVNCQDTTSTRFDEDLTKSFFEFEGNKHVGQITATC